MSARFWLRAAVFRGAFMQGLERRVVDRVNLHRFPDVEGYIDMFDTLVQELRARGRDLTQLKFLEIGTGQTLALPFLLKMAGAKQVVTVDITDMAVLSMTRNSLQQIQASERFKALLRKYGLPLWTPHKDSNAMKLPALLRLWGITFITECDLSKASSYSSESIAAADVVYSRNVMEHIPRDMLREILVRCATQLGADTLQIHRIDLSDHFSHAIPGMNALNFLRYSNRVWALLAHNSYIYQNRLRYRDMVACFKEAFEVVDHRPCNRLAGAERAAAFSFANPAFREHGEQMDVLDMLIVAGHAARSGSA